MYVKFSYPEKKYVCVHVILNRLHEIRKTGLLSSRNSATQSGIIAWYSSCHT